jgi:hypothetical protein
MADTMKPFPVVLDLTGQDAFYVLTTALEDFAGKAEFDAENDEQSAAYNGTEPAKHVETLRAHAAIAKQLLDDLHRQLDES